MKTPYIIIVALVVITISFPLVNAQSNEAGEGWVFVTNSNSINFYIKRDTMRRTSQGTITIWSKRYTRMGTAEGKQLFAKEGTKYDMAFEEHDCYQRRSRPLRIVSYDVNDSITYDHAIPSPEWDSPIPDTVGEEVLKAVCRTSNTKPPMPSVRSETRISSNVTSPKVKLPEKDYGVDIVVVNVNTANLREGPSTNDTVLKKLALGDLLVLLDRNPTDNWYNVIDVDTSAEGWIKGDLILVKYTTNRKVGPSFEERRTGSTENPHANVTNQTDKTLYLKVGDTRYSIAPNDTKTIYLTPGVKNYYASVPGVIPTYGEKDFTIGSWYTWRFYIITRRR